MLRPGSIAFIVLAGACAEPGPPAAVTDHYGAKPPTPTPSSVPGSAPAPSADEPTTTFNPIEKLESANELGIDWAANRHRLHLYEGAALVVTLATEGLRKYTQEYARPWGKTVTDSGTPERTLGRRTAELRIPWERNERVEIVAYARRSAPGQRVELRANGKRVATTYLPDRLSPVALGTTTLHRGENELLLYLSKAGTMAGTKTYGLWSYIVIRPEGQSNHDGEPGFDPTKAAPFSGNAAILTGFTRYRLYTEIPKSASLVWNTTAPATTDIRITATDVEGQQHSLYRGRTPATGRDQLTDLSTLAGQLVAIDLVSSSKSTRWEGSSSWRGAGPRIAVADAESQPGKTYRNAVVVVVDALRSDRLSLYGKTRVATPRITAEGQDHGVVFLHNQAASPSSPPSHGSIQTGMIPRVHGVTGDKGKIIAGTPTLSTQAEAGGVASAYYGNNPFGMARLEKPGGWTEFHQPGREGKGLDCTALVEGMLSFAKRMRDSDRRFLISSLPYEPHTPYRYHAGITEKYYSGPFASPVGKSVDGTLLGRLSSGSTTLDKAQWQQLYALYDGEVEYFDGCFATLLDGLEAMGARDETVVIITSDHGEGMFEHGLMGHAFGHYAELANVPFVVLARGLVDAPRTIETLSSHLDITPTVLALLGITPDKRIQGKNLVPTILRQGPVPPRVVSLEYGRSYALRSLRWKYIVDYQGKEMLFDLENDPREQNEVREKRHLPLRYLREVAGFFLAHRSQWRAHRWGDYNNHSAEFARAMSAHATAP